jgi:TRAP-type C4-dicarboxylate transport system permease small subunit
MLYAAVVVVAGLMMLTVCDVFGRYFFSHPVIGTTELTEYLMACLLVGMAPCLLAGRHIRIDIFYGRFRPRMKAILDIVYYLAGLFAIAILTWTGWRQALIMLDAGARSSMLEIPDFPFIMVLVVSFGILFIVMLILMIQRIVEVAKR